MADQVQRESGVQRARGGDSPLRLYKPGQGKYVRWGTAVGGGALAIAGAYYVYEQATRFSFASNEYLHTLVPVIFLIAAAYGIYWAVGRYTTAIDFMIATEGEMKKVNWSSRREVWGATRVVIVSVLGLALVLFVVDIFFMGVFSWVGVLKLDIVARFFGASD